MNDNQIGPEFDKFQMKFSQIKQHLLTHSSINSCMSFSVNFVLVLISSKSLFYLMTSVALSSSEEE